MIFREKSSGAEVGAAHCAEGTLFDGVRSEVGDWVVTRSDGSEELVKPLDFNERFEYVRAT